MTILIVEDDSDIRALMAFHLRNHGYTTEEAKDGEEALEMLSSSVPDLVLLDLMLPNLSGLDVLSAIRSGSSTKRIPVIVASALIGENDIIKALEDGADDYLTKPFSPKILCARVHSLLRRSGREMDAVSTSGGLSIDKGTRECFVSGEKIVLTATEFDILLSLVEAEGHVLRRGEIIERIKGAEYHVTERAIDVQIASIRKKLRDMGKNIATVWGIGYRYAEE